MARAVVLVAALAALVAMVLAADSIEHPFEERFVYGENPFVESNTHWTRSDEAVDPTEMVSFRLYLKQRNLDVLERELLRASDPRSEVYGNWWEIERITSLVAPSIRVRTRIMRAIKRFGVEKVVDAGDVIKCTGSVASAMRLFDTTFAAFHNADKSIRIVRQVGSYSLPLLVAAETEFISGITAFPPPPRAKKVREAFVHESLTPEDNQTGKVVPYVISTNYGIPVYPAYATNANSSVCLAEFQNDRSFSATDLSSFQTQNSLPAVAVAHIVGPYQPSVPDAEATLDVQYGSAIAINASVWFWTVDGWLLEFANDFYNTNPVPFVVSMSWGWPEDSQCQITSCNGYTSQQYVQRTNTEWQKIGLRGVSLLASSGDQGAPGDNNPYCQNSAEPISTIFPGASPWVTSVGATMFTPPSSTARLEAAAAPPVCTQFDCADPTWPEVACSFPDALITSGGGFSDYSPMPSWQSKEVATYFSTAIGLPPAQYFNSTNRGFPDISALGHNYLIYISGRWELVDGTSCSSPVIGGMVALWNDWLLNNGKPTLGFLNPLLYQMYEADPTNYKDITVGNNKCTESLCCTYGFPTATGWDAVTGLGAPNYAKMFAYIQANAPSSAAKK